MTPAREGLLLGVLLAVLVGAAYARTVGHPFLYDDVVLILERTEIRSLENAPQLLLEDATVGTSRRWVRNLSYALEYALVGPSPRLYHADNIALHALVAILVFALFRRVTGDVRIAWWTAAFFAVHPIATDVVAPAAGRRELLATVFALGSMLLLESHLRRGGAWRVALALVALYLAAHSKEMVVVAPVVFGMLHLQRERAEAGAAAVPPGIATLPVEAWGVIRRHAWLYGVLAVAVVGLTVELGGLPEEVLEEASGWQSPSYYDAVGSPLDALDRLRLVGLAARLTVVPVGLSVDYFYDALEIARPGWSAAEVVDLGFLVLAAALTLWGLARRSWVGVGGVWFGLFYLPHTGVVQWHEIFAERWLYTASIGTCLAGATALVAALERPAWRPVASGLAVIVLALFTGATVARTGVWSSSEALWSAAVARYPNSARARKGLGNAYRRAGDLEAALEQYRAAERILPPYRDAYLGEIHALMGLGRTEEGEAALDELLARWPDEPRGWYLKGQLLDRRGKIAQAIEQHERAIELDPDLAAAYNDLGRLHAQRGDVETAIRMFETALEKDPSLVTALRNLAIVYRMALGDEEKAAEYERRADALESSR
jgi:tetratricopeptide (TPR) repeat protein